MRRRASTEIIVTIPIGRTCAGPTRQVRHGPASINWTEDANTRAVTGVQGNGTHNITAKAA